MAVFRIYVEKKPEFAVEADGVRRDIETLGIKAESVRLFNRYDVEGVDGELFEYAKRNIFSEPQLDVVSDEIAEDGAVAVFGVEPLPGQFDQRADSAAQCIQIVSCKERPLVATAKIYLLYGDISKSDVEKIKKFVINPVECREAGFGLPATLKAEYAVPTEVETLNGFISLDEKGLGDFVKKYGLAMDADDVRFCRDYFASEKREPTLTEIRMIDTYWSDHCRHTTFLTTIDGVKFEDLDKPNVEAMMKGIPNLLVHLENIRKFGMDSIVAINHFVTDAPEETASLEDFLREKNIRFAFVDAYERGAKGGVGLAHKVIEALGVNRSSYHPLYDLERPLKEKIETIAKEIYRADRVEYSELAEKQLADYEARGYGNFYVCMAKTPNSLSDDPKLLGVPEHHIVHIREVELAKGARFVIPLAGSILRMPGLPKVPAAIKMEDEPW